MTNQNRNYHGWTSVEDAKLVEALVNMVNSGGYKADNGFKSGYLQHLEQSLRESLPNSGILGKPHIESRIKTMKKDWQVVYDMLNGANTSGFGYDNVHHCVTADATVWESYLKVHKEASKWKNKKLPHYEDLCVIFGKDRAQGNKAKDVYEMEEEVNIEEQELDEASSEVTESAAKISSGRGKKRKSRVSTLVDGFHEVVALLGDRLKETSAEMSEGIKFDLESKKKSSLITSELSKMVSLSQSERFMAIRKIKSDPDNVTTFWDLEEVEKEAWVRFMLAE